MTHNFSVMTNSSLLERSENKNLPYLSYWSKEQTGSIIKKANQLSMSLVVDETKRKEREKERGTQIEKILVSQIAQGQATGLLRSLIVYVGY